MSSYQDDWASALRALILSWLVTAGSGTSREIEASLNRYRSRPIKADTISGRLNELEKMGAIYRDGKKGCGPGRPQIVWRVTA